MFALMPNAIVVHPSHMPVVPIAAKPRDGIFLPADFRDLRSGAIGRECWRGRGMRPDRNDTCDAEQPHRQSPAGNRFLRDAGPVDHKK